ncbi:MAG TPA: potassium channel family protein [Candidatus Tectomicrobia bacterium]|nr:potassium channel family protein [Candidatus Tectomicrobia bacterium]
MTPGKRMLHLWARLRPAGFAQLTLFLGVILLATPLRQERRIFWVLLQLMFLDALLVSLSVSDIRPRLRSAFFAVWAAGFGANLGATLASRVESTQGWSLGTSSMAFILLAACVIVVLAYILRSPRVTLDVILAAVTAYLLIALSFAALYSLVFHFDSQSFRLPEWIERGSVEAVQTEMVYFSLVTLATLGYGDILPSSPFTQMLAVLEAVIGQFFIAVLVAWLVGMFISYNLTGR